MLPPHAPSLQSLVKAAGSIQTEWLCWHLSLKEGSTRKTKAKRPIDHNFPPCRCCPKTKGTKYLVIQRTPSSLANMEKGMGRISMAEATPPHRDNPGSPNSLRTGKKRKRKTFRFSTTYKKKKASPLFIKLRVKTFKKCFKERKKRFHSHKWQEEK